MMTTHDESAKAARKGATRTCAGCGKHAPADDLVRVVHDPSTGEVAVDAAASGFGRGGHLHPSPECFARAFKGGLAKVFSAKVVGDGAKLGAELVSAVERRLEGLLTGARRAGQLAVGADAVAIAAREGKAELFIVARDAAAAARLPEVERAIAAGKAIAFADKQRLGALTSKEEVAVLVVSHPGVAEAILRTYRMSAPFSDAQASAAAVRDAGGSVDASRSEAWASSSEVR